MRLGFENWRVRVRFEDMLLDDWGGMVTGGDGGGGG